MKNKKKLWIPIVAAVLAVAIGAGVLFASRMGGEEVAVFPVNMVGYTDFYSGSSESYGMVTTDKVQTLYLSDTQTVTEILVYPGQAVKKGDVLFTYDTTLSDLAIERKDLSIQQLQASLKNAQAELKELQKLKPMVIKPGATEAPSTSASDYTKSPSDISKLNTVYSTKTTGRSMRSPFYFWLGRSTQVTEAMIEEMFTLAGENVKTIYVVFQTTRLDKANSEFINQYGVSYTKVEKVIEIPTEPTEPTEPPTTPTEPDPSAPTDPSTPTDPEEPTDPSDPTDPTESTPVEVPSDPTVPEEPEEPTDPEEPGDNAQSQGRASVSRVNTTVEIRYNMRFFEPGDEVDEGSTDGSVDWNSGYTSAELTAMKSEKQAQIKQLQFDIKMAKAELNIMKKEADSGEVKAEFDGVVASIIEPSQALETGEPLVKVSGGGGYYVEGSVSELDLSTIAIGQQVTVTSWDTGGIYTGTITEVGGYPTEDQGYYGASNVSYYPYKVFIDESADLMEGYYVSMTYQTEAQAAGTLYLQNAFVRKDGNRVYVFVRNEEGLLEKRYLEAGVSSDGYMTPIYGGITEEDFLAFPYGRSVTEGAVTYEGTDQDLYGY